MLQLVDNSVKKVGNFNSMVNGEQVCASMVAPYSQGLHSNLVANAVVDPMNPPQREPRVSIGLHPSQ